MRAVTGQGPKHMSVEEVPDPILSEPTDAIIRVTTTGLCGSDLHLYEPLSPFMTAGDPDPKRTVEFIGVSQKTSPGVSG